MSISVSGQTLEFLNSALFGVFLAVFYDILRIIRICSGCGKAITAVLDVFFWLCAVCVLFGFILTVSEGQMRWYVLFGFFSGGFVYICTISILFIKTMRIIISVLIRSLSLLSKPLYFFANQTLKAGRGTKRRLAKAYRESAVKRSARRLQRKLHKKNAIETNTNKGRMLHGRKKKEKKSRDCS